HAAHRILRENRVENRIRNLVGDLVRVTFGHRLRREEITTITTHGRNELLRLRYVRMVEPSNSNTSIIPYLPSGAKLVIHRPETRLQNVRVDLRGRQIGVAEHHLDRAEIGASLEEVRRKRMSQHVRAQAARDAGLDAVLLQDLPETDPRQSA